MRTLRLITAVLLLLAFACVASACSSDDYGPIPAMQAMPESHLAPFPGAILIDSGPLPRKVGFMEATYPAQLEREFGVKATGADLVTSIDAHYDALLKPLGWRGGPGAWRKTGYEFEVLFNNPLAANTREQAYDVTFIEILREDLDVTPPPASRTP